MNVFTGDANEDILVYALRRKIVKSDETTWMRTEKRSLRMVMQFIFHWA